MSDMIPRPLRQAKQAALVLLKFRARSENELQKRLRRKGFSEIIIQNVLKDLKKTGLVDDAQFAQDWIENRYGQSYGPLRIKKELTEKGLDQQLISQKMESLRCQSSEKEIIEILIRKKMKTLNKLNPRIRKQRLYGYLLRRGFDPNLSEEAINQL